MLYAFYPMPIMHAKQWYLQPLSALLASFSMTQLISFIWIMPRHSIPLFITSCCTNYPAMVFVTWC